jgi:cbb3-type cytochrome oxidase subunit 3
VSFGTLTILICLFTAVAYVAFFRKKDEEYINQKNIIFDEDNDNISEEGKS